MLLERSSYPSPVARLALLAEMTDMYLPGEGSKMLVSLGLKPKEIAANFPGSLAGVNAARAPSGWPA
jgi:hypothetical protein